MEEKKLPCKKRKCYALYYQAKEKVGKAAAQSCHMDINKCYRFAIRKAQNKICTEVDGEIKLHAFIRKNQEKQSLSKILICQNAELKLVKTVTKESLKKENPKQPLTDITEQELLISEPEQSLSAPKKIENRQPSNEFQINEDCKARPWLCEDSQCGKNMEFMGDACRCLPGYKKSGEKCVLKL